MDNSSSGLHPQLVPSSSTPPAPTVPTVGHCSTPGPSKMSSPSLLLHPPPIYGSGSSAPTAVSTSYCNSPSDAHSIEILSRPPSPAISNSHLSVNTTSVEPKPASIASRHSSRTGSIQRVAATATALMQNAEARQIRLDLYSELVRGWYHLSTSSKALLAYYLGATFLEIVATIVVAVIERSKARQCFYLVIFLALYLARAIVISVSLIRRFLYDRPSDLPHDISGACGVHYKTMINWASLVLLLLSIALLTTQSHCAQDSTGLFYLVLVFSLLGYLCLAALLLLWFLVLFCLDGLVIILEFFGVGPRVMQWQGATPDMINKIPTIKFTKYEAKEAQAQTRTDQIDTQSMHLVLTQSEKDTDGMNMPSIVVSVEPTESANSAQPGLTRDEEQQQEKSMMAPTSVLVDIDHAETRIESPRAQASTSSAPVLVSEPESKPEDDSEDQIGDLVSLEHLGPEELELARRISTTCPICLCDYEDLEELRHLPCDHYFHKECVDEWLKLKRTCPLCKADIIRHRRKRWSRSQGNRRNSSSSNGSGLRRFSLGSR